MRSLLHLFLCVCAACLVNAAVAAAVHRFVAVDVYLVSPEPVAAWQFEFESANARIVGVENGESAAFRAAPYYDIKAVQRGDADRVVVADFSLDEPASLPSGRIRVATLHLAIAGGGDLDFDLELVTAVTPDGDPIDASIGLEPRTGGAR